MIDSTFIVYLDEFSMGIGISLYPMYIWIIL